jgi:hypothetical protein
MKERKEERTKRSVCWKIRSKGENGDEIDIVENG